MSYLLNVVWAIVLVVIVLYAMLYVARTLQRGRLVVGVGRRLVSTVESTMLAQNVTVHVVKVAERYYLLGGGSAGVALIAELQAADVEPFIATQRAVLAQQRASLLRPFARLWKP